MKDVTDKVETGINDGDALPILKCVCGARVENWQQVLDCDEKNPWSCPNCETKLIFHVAIRVFKVT